MDMNHLVTTPNVKCTVGLQLAFLVFACSLLLLDGRDSIIFYLALLINIFKANRK